jgi:transcriptional regulator with XRE-family HTH domain
VCYAWHCRGQRGVRPIASRETYRALLRRIEQRRRQLALSERALCLKAKLRTDAIDAIRRGNAPRGNKLHALAEALGVEIAYLTDALTLDTVLPRTTRTQPASGDMDLTSEKLVELPLAPVQKLRAIADAISGFLARERYDMALATTRLLLEELVGLAAELPKDPE